MVISGVNINRTVSFAAGGMRTVSLGPFNIIDDDVALEGTEGYSLMISNPSITQNVIASDSTDISIIDDDSKMS